MLALIHHMIIQGCHSGEVFQKYAILGDDIVIGDSSILEKYLLIMKTLGVNISLPKSIVSSDIVEFAKRIISRGEGDLSPIGSGLILSTLRNKYLLGLLIASATSLNYYSISTALKKILSIQGNPIYYELAL